MNRRAVQDAARTGARIAVLPELASSGYVFRDREEARGLAEPLDGPAVSDWCELAAELDVSVIAGMCELGPDALVYNTAVVIDGTGLRATYRKVHLWDSEKLVFPAGDQPPPVIDIAGSKVGVMICYDLEFPEWVRLAALAGAELLCAPANWPRQPRPDAQRPMEVVRVQAAAAVNRMFIAACDRAGRQRGVDWLGGSVIVDPDGWPLAGPRTDNGELIISADCQLGQARNKSISQRNDVHADRRPLLYTPILERGTR